MRPTGNSIIASICLVAVLLVPGCTEEPAPDPIRPVRWITVGDTQGLNSRAWPGRAKAAQEVDLGFEVAGQLAERPAEVGDEIVAGEVLARLDDRDYQNLLTRAEAERDRAKSYFDRIEEAAKTDAVSKQDVSDARARYDQADAQVRIRQKAVDDCVLVAPFEGVVSRTYVDNFQNVHVKQPVIRVLDVSTIELIINIPEHLINLVPYAKDIEVRFDALPGVVIPATIKEIGNEASEATRTFPVTLTMSPAEQGVVVQPGMAGEVTGRAEVPGELRQQGVEVPSSALFTPEASEGQETFVWILDDQTSTVHLRKVDPGQITARGATLVKGLEPGERIVTAGVHRLREGQQVLIQQAPGI